MLPAELTRHQRWVRRDERKVPRTTVGGYASVTNPATWATHADAAASGFGVGLGYVLAEGDGIICIDLDHCLDENGLAPWARRIVDLCPETFVEVSPSGTGLHIWGRGEFPRGRRLRDGDVSIEVYGQKRFVAVTGKRFESAPSGLADLSAYAESLVDAPKLDASDEHLAERVRVDEERLADAQRRMPKRSPGGPCAVCGGDVTSRQPRSLTCGSVECGRVVHAARMRVYLARRRLRDGLPYHARYAEQRRSYEKSRRGRKRDAFVERVSPTEVFERDGWKCQLCGESVRPFVDPRHRLAPSLDHIVPLALGGKHERANVQCAHYGCNSAKQARVT